MIINSYKWQLHLLKTQFFRYAKNQLTDWFGSSTVELDSGHSHPSRLGEHDNVTGTWWAKRGPAHNLGRGDPLGRHRAVLATDGKI